MPFCTQIKIYVGISVEIMYNENVYVYTYGKRKSIEGDSIMFDNQRKNICVVLCDVAEHYQEQVCRVLTSNARVKGYNIAYFSFFLSYGVNTKNGRGEANIINLIPYENFDGFIICHDTFQNEDAVKQLFRYIKERTRVPVITIRRPWEDYPCVLSKNDGSICSLVQHFVDVHGFDKIAFMSGPKDHPDAKERLNEYKEGLKSRNIDFDEKFVYYGDFWRTYAKMAARYFAFDLDERPQAIMCANDYMALALCNELISMGIMVPDDIAITGFDDIWESTINMPPITTVKMQVEEMSQKAFDSLEKMINGEEVPKIQEVGTRIAVRNSCGCEGMNIQSMLKKRVRQSQEHEKLLELVQNNTYMFVEMSDVADAEALVDHVRLLENKDNFVEHFFICLGEGRGKAYPKYCSKKPGYPPRMKAIGSVLNRRIIQTKPFFTSELLPKEAVTQEPMVYYFFPLHNLQDTFGYFAISYQGEHSCEQTFHSWIAILGNALENLRLKQKTHALLEELNSLYIHDALTGLLNRRGYENSTREMYQKSIVEQKSMAIFSIDMDDLKIVNDQFGHAQGDLALKTIARAMEYAAKEGDYCARIGGDEFTVFGLDYEEAEAEKFLLRFHEYLTEFNQSSQLPYNVWASCGYCIISGMHDMTLEEAVIESDARLYQKKRERKENSVEEVLRKKEG